MAASTGATRGGCLGRSRLAILPLKIAPLLILSGNREAVRVRLYYRGRRIFLLGVRGILERAFVPRKTTNKKGTL